VPILLNENDLSNTQQMEVSVNGPDGATHLILCTGIATLRPGSHAAYTFLVGPRLSRRQFVAAIAWGALSSIQTCNSWNAGATINTDTDAGLLSIVAEYDEAAGQAKIRTDVTPGSSHVELTISYHVSILAELTSHC
jgi:hypothetical protein